jgi:hypothetical protein
MRETTRARRTEKSTRNIKGDVMTKNGCESVACKCAAEASIKEAASMSAVSHNHARLSGILRYRGMENEAVMAARLIKIESFIANLRSITGDLEASMALATPSVEQRTEANGEGMPEQEFGTFAWRYVHLVERELKTALSKIRTGLAGAGEHSTREGEQHFDVQAERTNRGANDKSMFPEEERA